jgi:hypothetical protein
MRKSLIYVSSACVLVQPLPTKNASHPADLRDSTSGERSTGRRRGKALAPRGSRACVRRIRQRFLNEYFCPATETSYIRPPRTMVKIAIPLT